MGYWCHSHHRWRRAVDQAVLGLDVRSVGSTTNGGATWSAQRSGSDANPCGVAFSDAAHRWAVGPDVILATTDGGDTWKKQISVAIDKGLGERPH